MTPAGLNIRLGNQHSGPCLDTVRTSMYHIKDYHDRQEKGDGKEGIAAKMVFCTDEKNTDELYDHEHME